MDDRETARQHATPIVVFTQPDVCKSPVAPVPYPIIAPLDTSILTTSTVRATKVPTFTLKSRVPLVIGDEAGVGMGIKSGTFSGTGLTWPTGSSGTVRAEKFLLVRHNDPFLMNGGNTTGKLVYQPGGAPRARIDAAGKPTRPTNPPVQPTPKEQGWGEWMSEKAGNAWEGTKNTAGNAWEGTKNAAGNAWDGTKQLAGDAYEFGKQVNAEYKVIPRALGGVQAVGGVAEIGLGAVGLAAPTGVTQVVGGVAVVHGVDTTSTGLRQLWTGEFEQTLTEQAISGGAQALGASPGTADTLGAVGDAAAGLVNPANIGRKLLGEGAEKAAKEAAEKLAKETAEKATKEAAEKAAKEAAEKAAKEKAAKEAAQAGADGVRVLKKPPRPDTSKVKYPDDMTPYQKADGTWDWEKAAPDGGFKGPRTNETLPPGTVLDRFGGDGGKYFSPPGTPYDARALSPDSLTQPYRAFEVVRPLPVQSGQIAPAFGMPGGGTQFLSGQRLGDLLNPSQPGGAFLREIY